VLVAATVEYRIRPIGMQDIESPPSFSVVFTTGK
jgi:hypothetical protein